MPISWRLGCTSGPGSNSPGRRVCWSPRLSPDGRYLAALSQDSSTLTPYDFRTQQWANWLTEPANIAFPTWSRRSVYFDNFLQRHPASRRFKLGDTHSEELFSLSGLRRFSAASGTWGGMAPDNCSMAQEIFPLELQLR